MVDHRRPIEFLNYLPQVFRTDDVEGVNFLSKFLKAFEILFEELQGEIEGTPDLACGGLADLFSPDTIPPAQFAHLPQPQFDYLEYLASWIGLPLRTDVIRRERETDNQYNQRRMSWNREFFKKAISLYPQRSTFSGMDSLLRAWLKGDLLETEPPTLILTDLTRTHADVDTIFQLAPESDDDKKPGEIYAQLGVNTVLGEGPPFLFIADLITDPAVPELRNPAGLDVFQRTTRFLLDNEKPAHTYYQLRVRAHTMQLAPTPPPPEDSSSSKNTPEWYNPKYARVGVTTLLWDSPWVFNSDCYE